MDPIASLLLFILQCYTYVIIASVVVSWLVAFEVINGSNPKAQNLLRLLGKATDPVYKPIRKYVPAVAGIDLSPIIVIFGIFVLQNLIVRAFY